MSKTFQPDSLHPYIMDARLKKATGSGGISVNIDISTSENKTGRIINDKPEYVKEISLTNTSLTAGTNIDILASGVSQYDQVTGCRLVYTSDSEKGSMDCPVWIDVSGSKISVKPTGTASSLTSLKAILKYLKS